MSGLRIFVAGTGTVGMAFARSLQARQNQIVGAWNRSQERAEEAQAELGLQVTWGPVDERVSEADLVLICVSDDAIREVALSMHESGFLKEGVTLAHCSGCLSSSVMGPIAGVALGSIHPLLAYPQGTKERTLEGVRFVIEGSPQATNRLKVVIQTLNGRTATVRAELKPAYHAAATLASNLQVSLLSEAIRMAERAGLTDAQEALTELAIGAIEPIAKVGPARALSGPVTRGDHETINKHFKVLPEEVRQIYRLLSLKALGLARKKGLSDEQWEKMRRTLVSH